jgi:His/Glu/Gln/Arg/opine family amino acid ABC transporter permease subunit
MLDIALIGSILPTLISAATLTLKLTALVIMLGCALALPVALCKNARSPALRAAASAYVLFFRGTPALVQLFLLYYGAGQFELIRGSWLWPVLPQYCSFRL